MTKKVEKPWGNFLVFSKNEKSTVKILTIKPKQKLSLQYHLERNEFWRVLSGDCKIVIGEKEFSAKAGDEFKIKKKQKHRIIGGKKVCEVLEISKGNFSEKDIVRLEDEYKRI